MRDSDLKFRIEGPDAERLAVELGELVESELGGRAERRPDAPPRDAVVRGDPLAVAAVVLAIPGALLAGADLARRLELKEKVGRLTAWARERAGGHRVEVIDADGRGRPLDETEAAEVIEIAVTIHARVTRRRPA